MSTVRFFYTLHAILYISARVSISRMKQCSKQYDCLPINPSRPLVVDVYCPYLQTSYDCYDLWFLRLLVHHFFHIAQNLDLGNFLEKFEILGSLLGRYLMNLVENNLILKNHFVHRLNKIFIYLPFFFFSKSPDMLELFLFNFSHVGFFF